MAKVVRQKEMPVPLSLLYQVIVGFESYPEFLPEVVSAKIIKQTDHSASVKFELEIVKRFSYSLDFKMEENRSVSWKLIESDFFKMNQGKWLLKPADGHSTSVDYELEVAFGFLVPGWVTKKLTEINLPKMFDQFESRAKVGLRK